MDNNLLYMANPMSRSAIRSITTKIRKKFKFDDLYFPLIEFMEFIVPQIIDTEFYLEPVIKNELPDCYARAIPEKHKIVIREDVYYAIHAGNRRHRFTLAHELGHYIMHNKETVLVLNRKDIDVNVKINIPKYRDPEWQANTFAGELLVPFGKISELSIQEIVDSCEVSYEVACIQLSENHRI